MFLQLYFVLVLIMLPEYLKVTKYSTPNLVQPSMALMSL